MKAHILIASQDDDIIHQLSETLLAEGHDITTFDNPHKLIAQCRKQDYDIIFVDVHFLGMSYDRLILQVKKIVPAIEVIIVTTYALLKSLVEDETLDTCGYILKPLSQEKIRGATNRAARHCEFARKHYHLLEAVTTAKQEWEATVDAIDDPIFVTDLDYTIVRGNLATYRILGKGVDDVIGHKCYEVFHHTDYAIDKCPTKRARDSGRPSSEIIPVRGLRRMLVCTVYPQVFATGGGLVHILQEPPVNMEQQAQTLVKYERLFDDARMPIILASMDDLKIIDMNQGALALCGHAPETVFHIDLEDLFPRAQREDVIRSVVDQVNTSTPPLRTKILSTGDGEIEVFLIANAIDIGADKCVEIFVIPTRFLSGERKQTKRD